MVPATHVDAEYTQMLVAFPFGLNSADEADALGRSVFDRLCEATPWRIALTVDDGDRIVEIHPAIDSPT